MVQQEKWERNTYFQGILGWKKNSNNHKKAIVCYNVITKKKQGCLQHLHCYCQHHLNCMGSIECGDTAVLIMQYSPRNCLRYWLFGPTLQIQIEFDWSSLEILVKKWKTKCKPVRPGLDAKVLRSGLGPLISKTAMHRMFTVSDPVQPKST